MDKRREYAPLHVVRGSSDKEWAVDLPRSLTFTIEGVRFFLVHNKKDAPADLSDADVVIYGHSHNMPDSFAVDGLPAFLEQTEQLKAVLQSMSPKDLRALWKCNEAIAKLNIERLERMDLRRNLTSAILSYEGIQYRYMALGVMETAHLDYLREHLRILSGFYGLLRPFDGVTPYRTVLLHCGGEP